MLKKMFSLTMMYYYTGGLLFLSGIVYLIKGDFDYFLSWAIFGCMYLVMDSYTPKSCNCSKSEKCFCYMRHVFGGIGLVLSATLLGYVLFYV